MLPSLAIALAFAPFAPWAAAQNNTANAQVTPTTPSTAVAAAPTEATPTFVFQPQPTMTACQKNSIRWEIRGGVDPNHYLIEIHAFNIGVDQSIPAPSSSAVAAPNSPAAQTPATSSGSTAAAQTPAAASPSSSVGPSSAAAPSRAATSSAPFSGTLGGVPANTQAVARRNPAPAAEIVNLVARANYNVTVVKGWSGKVPYPWTPELPEGRYKFVAVSNDTTSGIFAYSETFTIVEGNDTSCINSGSDAASTGGKTAAVPTTGNVQATETGAGGSTSENQGGETKKAGVSGGAIAGIVIGVIAALVIAALLFICCRRRNNQEATVGGKLIGSPQNFRKASTKRASKFGMALSAFGRGNSEHNRNVSGSSDSSGTTFGDGYDVEKATPPLPSPATPAAARPSRSGRTTAMSGESENPFQTAPSTPVEEKHHNLDSAGLAAATAAAAAAGSVTPPSRAHHADPLMPPPNRPSSMPMTASGRSSAHLYTEEREGDDYRLSGSAMSHQHRSSPSHDSGPHPLPSLPQTPATPNTPGGNSGRYSQATSYVSGHRSTKSTSSAMDAVIAQATAVPEVPSSMPRSSPPQSATQPPSSYQTPASPGSPRGPERKNSLRRKPVPKLNVEDDIKSESHSSPSASDEGHKDKIVGSPSDQFGLNAALAGAGLDRGLSFKLMPDPPLPQDD